MCPSRRRTTEPTAPLSAALVSRLGLRVLHPRELSGTVLPLDEVSEIGREVDGAGRLEHGTISRRHAKLERILTGYLVTDLGSTNGTFVGASRADEPKLLVEHSLVRFGDVITVVCTPSPDGFYDMPELLGTTHEVMLARQLVGRAAAGRAPILVLGETGTGKERIAQAVHARSGRRGPLVCVNCAELRPELIESQLFGHERGAFTGAQSSKDGLFVAAHEGTLFLDEVGELPIDLQAKLLRVLETGEVRRLGALDVRSVDVRVVAATNRDPAEAVRVGAFRSDLLARLAYFEVVLPPVRSRRADILEWLQHFEQAFLEEHGAPTASSGGRLLDRLTPDAAQRLLSYRWPDNLRGLHRLVHRVALLSPEASIGETRLREVLPELFGDEHATLLPRVHGASPPVSDTLPVTTSSSPQDQGERPSRDELLRVYVSLERSVRATAKHFAKDRRQIYRWLDAYGIER
jgi:transcriptional regulator with GAF, ATPase, and Fis domain